MASDLAASPNQSSITDLLEPVFSVSIMHGDLQIESAAAATGLFIGTDANDFPPGRPDRFSDFGVKSGAMGNSLNDLSKQSRRLGLG
jgi:hypothetical protein